jgi:Protein of unknown function (DUF3499)
VPSAIARASNAGPTFADEAGTRTRQPFCTRVSLARSRSSCDCHCPARRDGYLQHMSERRAASNTNRQCARFGCSAVAVATFTFDSDARTVWLDTPLDGNARAGELCSRHANALTPPRGWQLEDRRAGRSEAAEKSGTTSGSGAPSQSAAGALPLEHRPASGRPRIARQLAAGPLGAGLEAELRGLLNAHSPLLARAFRSSGTV